MLLANLALWRGESSRAVSYGRDTLARFEALGDPWGQSQGRAVLTRALACVGRIDDARDLLDQVAQRNEPNGFFGQLRAQALVHLGDPEALPAALHLGIDEGSGPEALVSNRLALGLALTQAGRVAEAQAELEAARAIGVPGQAGSANAVSAAAALVFAAAGRADDARQLADDGAGAGTYLDQLEHGMAGAFARLRLGEPDAADAFDAVVAASDATESRLDQAITRLARAHAWRALARSDADAAERDARARLENLGIGAPGWDRLFSLAAGA
jgi:hypothetical protein